MSGCHDGSQPTATATALPTAQVAVAKRGDIVQTLTVAGQFQPYQVVDVHPKVSGYMVKINVDIGDIVHKGETLAVLEVPELTAQVEQTAFEVKQSQEEITRAEHEVKRTEAANYALHLESVRLQQAAATRPGLIAQQELDDAQSRDLATEAQVDAAKAALAAAQQHAEAARADSERVQALENYTRVTAPLDGVVIWRYADTGALIQGGTNTNTTALPIVRVSQSSLLRLRFPVPEDDFKYIHKGDPVEVRVDAIGRSFTGTIVRFTRNVNFETRTMETEVDVPNQSLTIAPGMYTNAHLTLATLRNVVTVPIEALILKGQQDTVYVVDGNGRVHIRNVQVGLRGQKLAGLTSGLNVGEQVVVGGQAKYQDGESVNPLVISSPASETSQVTGGMIDMKAEQAITNASLAPN
ncbi:MAG: efflux RND transporter periplasmic adaptor subunit [Acidobacteriota bacterium]